MFNGKLLDGINIVELATFVAAPSACRVMADMGAKVIKVESIPTYDINGDKRTLVRSPIMYQEAGLPKYERGPYLGENTTEILEEIGYTEEQIQKMIEAKDVSVWKK